MKTILKYTAAGFAGFVILNIMIAGIAFIPIFYQCRISETASCMFVPALPPAEAFAKADPVTSRKR